MNTNLTQSQLDAYWMPFTANRQFKKDPRIIVEAEGCYFTSAEGKRIFDGLSGLWDLRAWAQGSAHRPGDRRASQDARLQPGLSIWTSQGV